MYEQAQNTLTLMAMVLEIGFGLWFVIAFPHYCWRKAEAARMQSTTEAAMQQASFAAIAEMSEETTQAEIDEQSNEKSEQIEQKKGEAEMNGLTGREENGAIAHEEELPTLDLTGVQLLITPTKVAVMVGDLDTLHIQVPQSIRRKKVKGQSSFYVQDLQRVFRVLLPEGVSV